MISTQTAKTVTSLIFAVGLLMSAAPRETFAQDSPPPASSIAHVQEFSGGPYCGLYSLYGALRATGHAPDFNGILQEKYLGSEQGSSLAELEQAARDAGASAQPMHNLTLGALRASRDPIVLHVRRPGRSTPYLHWILFLGVEGHMARIVDPPAGVELISLSDLAALWDGVGLVVSRKEQASTAEMVLAPFAENVATLCIVIVALGLAVSLLYFAQSSGHERQSTTYPALARVAFRFTALLAVATGVSSVRDALSADGFARNEGAVGQVAARHFDVELPTMTAVELHGLLVRQEVVVLDARLPVSYAARHIPSAISLPMVSSLGERTKVLNAIDPGQRVVVYCQSESCTWAKALAGDLVFRGYRSVAVLAAGMNGWQDYEESLRSQ
jgi:rhodanese-related sulfurtransferase